MSLLKFMVLSVATSITPLQVERIAALAEACVHKPYPYAILHVLKDDEDIQTPRQMYPAFYGCYDWHSAVHGHWLLARVGHLYPNTEMAKRAKALLAKSLTLENLRTELDYLVKHPAFERPYGIAWLLQLGAELRQWPDPDAQIWSDDLAPLENQVAEVFMNWLAKTSLPVRAGTHSQTAFALGLAYDWAQSAKHTTLGKTIELAAKRFYAADVACPIAYEPSAHDFLSPCLAEADLMRRILPADEFRSWVERFLSELHAGSPLLVPAVVSDPSDGHIVHLDGLNLSRAWMMHNIAQALPPEHPLAKLVDVSADKHRKAGLHAVTNTHYAGSHWLGTFAMYLVTQRGARP